MVHYPTIPDTVLFVFQPESPREVPEYPTDYIYYAGIFTLYAKNKDTSG